MASQRADRMAPRAVIVGLIALAIVFLVIGAIYLAEPARHLPGFFPGHSATATKHHTKHGVLAIVLAALALIGAWLGSGRKRHRWDS